MYISNNYLFIWFKCVNMEICTVTYWFVKMCDVYETIWHRDLSFLQTRVDKTRL